MMSRNNSKINDFTTHDNYNKKFVSLGHSRSQMKTEYFAVEDPNLVMIVDQYALKSGYVTCEDCGKSYKNKGVLYDHKRYSCNKEPQFQCPYCDKRCRRTAHLKSHIYCKHKQFL